MDQRPKYKNYNYRTLDENTKEELHYSKLLVLSGIKYQKNR